MGMSSRFPLLLLFIDLLLLNPGPAAARTGSLPAFADTCLESRVRQLLDRPQGSLRPADFDGESLDDELSPYGFCAALAEKRGFRLSRGRGALDVHRAGLEVLKDCVDGACCLAFAPPPPPPGAVAVVEVVPPPKSSE